ncbi:MAG: response regulator receiver protein [Labilithrix sp.]|nr:response regulator receiver protein [Labilithrix sp.]
MTNEAALPGTRRRILVVDDEDRNRRLLDALLAPEGYEVLQAASGAEALATIVREPVDVVLLDRMMPGLDGIETCRRIRGELGRLDLPIVFVTAAADRQSRVAAKQAGADDFLVKPIDEYELFARLENLLLVKAYRDLREHQRVVIEAELQQRTSQLLRAERLATVGTLAAGVGHELNNVAQVMNTALYMIRASVAKQQVLALEDLDALVFVSEHLASHAAQMLRLGKPEVEKSETFDVRAVVSSTLSMLRLAGRTKMVQVRAELPASPQWMTGSRVNLEQVLVNLVANAADAITGVGSTGGGQTISVTLTPAGSRIRVSVTDDGPGMAEEVRARIFDAYFTTKPAGYGTGLGLPVVKHIVASLGGELVVTSTVGHGTSMSFDVEASNAGTAWIQGSRMAVAV